MADLTPTTATNASALDGTERIPCTQGGLDRALTPAQIKTALENGGGTELDLTGLTGFKPVLSAYKTADQSVNNSAVLVADNHLAKTVTASHVYRVEIDLPFDDNSTGAAAGLKVAISGTATITNMALHCETIDYAAGMTNFSRIVAKDAATEAAGGLIDSGTVKLRGVVEINAGGTFLLQWAQQNATTGNTTVLRDAGMVLIDIT